MTRIERTTGAGLNNGARAVRLAICAVLTFEFGNAPCSGLQIAFRYAVGSATSGAGGTNVIPDCPELIARFAGSGLGMSETCALVWVCSGA